MKNTYPKYIYEFDFHDIMDVLKSFESLLKIKKEVLPVQKGADVDLYFYLEQVNDYFVKVLENNELVDIDMQMLSFFDIELASQFIADYKNESLYAEITEQLGLLFVAIGGIGEGHVYTVEQMKAFSLDSNLVYDNIFLLHTLHNFALYVEDEEYLIYFYDLFVKSVGNISKTQYDWKGAFSTAYFLQIFYRFFYILPHGHQENLLSNFLVFPFVINMPIRNLLSFFIITEEKNTKENNDFVLGSILKSNESIPEKTDFSEWQKLSKVTSTYLVRAESDSTGSFAKEKYIQDLYKFQSNRDKFSIWLRDILNLADSLKKEEFVKE